MMEQQNMICINCPRGCHLNISRAVEGIGSENVVFLEISSLSSTNFSRSEKLPSVALAEEGRCCSHR